MKKIILLLALLSGFSFAQGLFYTPSSDATWLLSRYNIHGAVPTNYNPATGTFTPIQVKHDVIPVFGTSQDSTRLTNTTEVSGDTLLISDPYEGSGTLFVSGDSISGTTPTVTVKYAMLIGIAQNGDELWSEKFTLGTVPDSLLKGTVGSGSLTGQTFRLGDHAEWTNAEKVVFFFSATGTHVTDIIAILKRGR